MTTLPGLERICAWCRGPIDGARRDALTCSQECRQARNRFVRASTGDGSQLEPDDAGRTPLRLAYADPPYPGLSRRYYEGHPDYAGEVDHAELIGRLCSDFDGWALSTDARSLQFVLGLCPPDVRVASWTRGERPTQSRRPLSAWEPVIYWGGRLEVGLPSRRPGDRVQLRSFSGDVVREVSPLTVATDDASLVDDDALAAAGDDTSPSDRRRTDALVHFSRPRLTDVDRVVGSKPATFALWMFELLGALPLDDFTDVFPGSGGIARAWRIYAGEKDSPGNAWEIATPTPERNPS